MQLNLFTAAPAAASDPLRVTPLPELIDLVARVGTDEDWAGRTLSDVLDLWYMLHDEFVDALSEPRKYAKERGQKGGTHYAEASPIVRQHYQRELVRITDAINVNRSLMDTLYVDRMQSLLTQAKSTLQARGVEGDLDGCDEFIGEVFRRPDPQDLTKRMPQLVEDLTAEYLRLQ